MGYSLTLKRVEKAFCEVSILVNMCFQAEANFLIDFGAQLYDYYSMCSFYAGISVWETFKNAQDPLQRLYSTCLKQNMKKMNICLNVKSMFCFIHI